jgi:hypothetical protein
MQTNFKYSLQAGVDPEELDRQIADMFRDVANEPAEDLHFPTNRPLPVAQRPRASASQPAVESWSSLEAATAAALAPGVDRSRQAADIPAGAAADRGEAGGFRE